MWIDPDGVAHSVALPDPNDLMALGFKASLDALLSTRHAAVSLILEQEGDRFLGQDLSTLADPEKESVFEGLTPSGLLLAGHVSVPEDIRTAIERIDWRWRFDVICALDDYID